MQTLVKLSQSNPYIARNFISPVFNLLGELIQVENPRYPPFSKLQFTNVIQNCFSAALYNQQS